MTRCPQECKNETKTRPEQTQRTTDGSVRHDGRLLTFRQQELCEKLLSYTSVSCPIPLRIQFEAKPHLFLSWFSVTVLPVCLHSRLTFVAMSNTSVVAVASNCSAAAAAATAVLLVRGLPLCGCLHSVHGVCDVRRSTVSRGPLRFAGQIYRCQWARSTSIRSIGQASVGILDRSGVIN